MVLVVVVVVGSFLLSRDVFTGGSNTTPLIYRSSLVMWRLICFLDASSFNGETRSLDDGQGGRWLFQWLGSVLHKFSRAFGDTDIEISGSLTFTSIGTILTFPIHWCSFAMLEDVLLAWGLHIQLSTKQPGRWSRMLAGELILAASPSETLERQWPCDQPKLTSIFSSGGSSSSNRSSSSSNSRNSRTHALQAIQQIRFTPVHLPCWRLSH